MSQASGPWAAPACPQLLRRAASATQASATIRTSAAMCIVDPLRGVPPRAHAARIGRAVLFVGLLVLVEAVEAAGTGADQSAERRALARALASVGNGAAGRADRRAERGADGAVLHDLHGLVLGLLLRARLGRRVAIARLN